MTSPFHGPLVALVALVAFIWALAVLRRVGEIRARRVRVQSLARARDAATALDDTRAMDNFNNLLQAPLLFCLLCLAFAQVGENAPVLVAGAWLYVLLRALHSAIQVTYNRVMHRFQAWMLGNLLLFALWGAFAARHLVPA